jgi:hypothetical protein
MCDHLRRMASLRCRILSMQVLHLLIQDPRRDKEEVENWRQRTRHPSVPVEYLCIFLVIIEHMFLLILVSLQQHSSEMAC